ncbi:MAG: T9SS type A sorting domain-containing protein [Ignavibacteria bacterium]|nr:T9SS type A sorting domain-containing protein [Ignavibacteria bacterium]
MYFIIDIISFLFYFYLNKNMVMKKLFIIFSLFFLLINSRLYSQWLQVYAHNPSQTCMVIKFFDVNTGYNSGVLYNGSNNNIYKTTNGGLNWIIQNSGYTAQRFMAIHIVHPDTVYICGNYGKVLRTYNGGQNWNLIYADTTRQFWDMQFVNSNTGYITGSYGHFMKTTNKGDNWTVLSTGVQNAMQGMCFLNENTGFISGAPLILKTTDGGNTWQDLNAPYVSSLETFTDVKFFNESTGLYSTNAGRIVRTSDGGSNWTQIYYTPGTAVWRLSFIDSNKGYGCTSDGKIVNTTNGGILWGFQFTPVPVTENIYNVDFPSLLTGYACTWSGKILKTTNGGLSYISQSGTGIPDVFALKQNYPNPFNSMTNVEWQMLYAEHAKIIVYDVMGKEVAVLVDEKLSAGSYSVSFNGGNLTSGVYFYKMTAGNYTETKKMIIIR